MAEFDLAQRLSPGEWDARASSPHHPWSLRRSAQDHRRGQMAVHSFFNNGCAPLWDAVERRRYFALFAGNDVDFGRRVFASWLPAAQPSHGRKGGERKSDPLGAEAAGIEQARNATSPQLRRERFSLDRARSQIAAPRRGGMLRALLRRPPRGGARHRVRTPLASGPAPADRRTASPTFRRTPGQPQGELSRPPAARTASARAREHTGRSVGQPGRLLVRSAGAGAGMGARW